MGIKMNASLYLQSHILASLDVPLILAINEFNRIFDQPTILYDFVSDIAFFIEMRYKRREINNWAKTWKWDPIPSTLDKR